MSKDTPGRIAGRKLRAAEKAVEAVEEMKTTVDELSDAVDELLPAVISGLRFTTESARVNLVQMPYKYFPEFVPDPQRDYDRGEVTRMSWNKYLLPDGGRIDQGQTPATSNRCLLHRDTASFDPDGEKRIWVREELCLLGMWRWDEESGNSAQHGWYEVITRLVASATPPYNDGANWEYKGTTNPER